MNILRYISIILLIASVPIAGVHADRLPNATMENQVISISTIIDVIGMVDTDTWMSWDLSSDHLHNGVVNPGESAGSLVYTDSMMTNGGHLMLNSNFDFSSGNKADGLNNLDREKVYTYESIDGSHLVADEALTIQTTGNYTNTGDYLRCVFSSSSSSVIPAFCNTVTAKSSLVNINSAQVSTSAKARMVSDSAAPAGLSYQIAVTPASDHEFAIGSVSTAFSGHVLEARDAGAGTWNQTAADNTFKDETEVTGSIRQFSKTFEYGSGFRL